MNVVTPKLKPQDYPRANYLKAEIEHARRYLKAAKKTGETTKAELLCDYLETSAVQFRVAVGNPTDEAAGQGDV